MVAVGFFALLALTWIVAFSIGTQAAIAGAIVMTVICVGAVLINLMLIHLVESNLRNSIWNTPGMTPYAALKKPTVDEVHNILQRHSALIVHFSGAPKGSGVERGHLYPQDLYHVNNGMAMGGVSCSVVCPTDVFHGDKRNAMGCIGLVLDLTESNSLVAVSPHDCGSIEISGKRCVEHEVNISTIDVEKSITNRQPGSHNEWVLRDFKVLGVFAVYPFEISMQSKLCRPEDAPEYFPTDEFVIGLGRTNLTIVQQQFPELPVYSFHQGKLIGVAQHSDIYHP